LAEVFLAADAGVPETNLDACVAAAISIDELVLFLIVS
jgi:hypothetical protein